jgi:adenosylcobinamide-GDP ribazoletransferase
LRWLMIARIGGTTGDTAGALVEISELVVLIALLLN